MERTFKVATAQLSTYGRDYIKNTEKAILTIEKAKAMGADIVLFPECFVTGYAPPISYEEALCDDSEYIAAICKKAKELHIGIVITAFTKGKTKPQNTAFVVDKNGAIILKYSKVHTCDFSDEACLESGDEFKVCDFDGVKIGIMICYDREYPESARVLMLKGAELILVPNDCGGMVSRVQALSTRAYENMVGVVMANPPGENAGCSCAFSPIVWDGDGRCVDNRIFIANEFEEAVFMAEFDLIKLRAYRSREMMGNTFRKVKAYSELLSNEIKEPFIRKTKT